MISHKEIIGKKYSFLTVIEKVGQNQNGKSLWLCECDCGQKIIKPRDYLTHKKAYQKSCGCKKWQFQKNKRQHTEIATMYILSIKRHAKGRNIPCNLSLDDIWKVFVNQNKKCAISGIDITIAANNRCKTQATASLDRIDSNKAYTIDNIQWIHKDINKIKSDFDQSKFLTWCKIIAEFNK